MYDVWILLQMAATCWWYYIAKFTEFFDTIFFNLRKKTEHVSTLHVIHHGCMPFSVWLGMKFAPGNLLLFCYRIGVFSQGLHYTRSFLTKPFFFFFNFLFFGVVFHPEQEATAHSLLCLTLLFILLCTSTTWLPRWDHNIKNISGGSATSPLSKW